MYFESKYWYSSHHFFFFCLGPTPLVIKGILFPHVNFRIMFTNFVEKVTTIMIRTVSKLWIAFSNMADPTVLSLPSHQHGKSLSILVLSFVFFHILVFSYRSFHFMSWKFVSLWHTHDFPHFLWWLYIYEVKCVLLFIYLFTQFHYVCAPVEISLITWIVPASI